MAEQNDFNLKDLEYVDYESQKVAGEENSDHCHQHVGQIDLFTLGLGQLSALTIVSPDLVRIFQNILIFFW